MAKVIRHEFVGSYALLVLLFVTGIGIPLAVVHLLEELVTIEDEVADPAAYVAALRK